MGNIEEKDFFEGESGLLDEWLVTYYQKFAIRRQRGEWKSFKH